MKSRGLVAALAVLMAAIATMAIFLYINGVREEAETGGDRVKVIVAQQAIPAGTELDGLIDDGAFTTKSIPEDDVVDGAVGSLSELQDQKTSSPILVGEQVSTARLQGSTELPGGTLGIPAGFEGLTLALDSPRLVGSDIQAGDHVAIYGSFVSRTAQGQDDVTVKLVSDAQVLKFLGPGDAAFAESGAAQPMITLGLKPKDSHNVVFALEKGTVWLTLLPPGDKGSHTAPVRLGNVLR